MSKLPQKLLDALGFNEEVLITRLGGNENENYLVESVDKSKKQIVKKVIAHTQENQEREVLYRQRLLENGVPVISLFEFNDNSFTFADDDGFYIAMDFVEGSTIKDTSNDFAKQLAELQAQFNSVDYSSLPYRANWLGPESIKKMLSKASNDFSKEKELLLEQLDQMPDFWSEDFARGVVHGDLHSGNVLEQGGRIVSILDWEEVSVEPLILDLGATISNEFLNDKGLLDIGKTKLFLQSYNSVRQIPGIEKENLVHAINFARLTTVAWAMMKISAPELQGTEAHYNRLIGKLNYPLKALELFV